MKGAWQMIFSKLAFLSNVYENELVAAIHSAFYRIDVGFAHTGLGVVHNL